MKPIIKTIVWLTIFSIAMGFLETAIVFYLRKLYYPEGFKFPLIPVTRDIGITEFFREIATIIMLVGAGILAGKNKLQRFVFFLYCFAIWDIFYYVFLKVLLDWPQSLLTWDILFLIPVPWVGPVIAPCIISLSMIVLTFIVVHFQETTPYPLLEERRGSVGSENTNNGIKYVHISFFEWLLFIFGSITAIASFMWDYIIYISKQGSDKGVWTLSSNKNMFDEVKNYVPQTFNWSLFGVGEGLLIFA